MAATARCFQFDHGIFMKRSFLYKRGKLDALSMEELGQYLDGMIFRYAPAGYTMPKWRVSAAFSSSFVVLRFRLSRI
jgi:hypothetical protein